MQSKLPYLASWLTELNCFCTLALSGDGSQLCLDRFFLLRAACDSGLHRGTWVDYRNLRSRLLWLTVKLRRPTFDRATAPTPATLMITERLDSARWIWRHAYSRLISTSDVCVRARLASASFQTWDPLS
jgi:hypothetical protein